MFDLLLMIYVVGAAVSLAWIILQMVRGTYPVYEGPIAVQRANLLLRVQRDVFLWPIMLVYSSFRRLEH